jgi:hypothetical protein
MDSARQGTNWYIYGNNNPLRFVDRDGRWFWDLVDIGSFLYSFYEFVTDPSVATGANLALDTVGLLPIIPSAATVKGAVNVIDGAIDAARVANKVDNVIDTGKYVLKATKNADSSIVMLGKTMQDGVGYVEQAKKYKATYFHLDDWDNIARSVGENNIWEINKQFVTEHWNAGKDFFFSHNPWEATGTFQREVLHLIDLGANDFVQVGDGLWKAIR